MNSKTKAEDIEFTGGYNLLMLKAEEGNINEVHRILTEIKNIDINAGNKKGYTALALAIKSGHIELVKLLLSAGADPNKKNNSGQNSLFLACWHNFEIIVRLVLDSGADINSVDHRGWTPLMIAAYHGHRNIVKELLVRRADVSAQDLFGKKAIDRAKDPEVLRLIQNVHNRLTSPRKQQKDSGLYSPSVSSAQKSHHQPSSILKKSNSKISMSGQSKIENANQSLMSPQSTAFSMKSPSLNSTQRKSNEQRATEPRRNSNQQKLNTSNSNNNTLNNTSTRNLQVQSNEKSSSAGFKATLSEIISPIKSTTNIRISSSPSSQLDRQLFKEDMEKLLMDQMSSMCHKIQQVVERKVALEIPMQMQTYEFQFKKEIESILKFKAADIFKNLQAIFNLKLKFCLTRLGFDTANLGLAPFLENEANYVPESISFSKDPLKLYNEKEYKAIENDIDRLERSILSNKVAHPSGRNESFSPTGHHCDHTSQVHKTEMKNDLLDVLGQEVRSATEYLLDYSNGKVSDLTREESGVLYKRVISEVTDSMELLEDELKLKFEEIITHKLNRVTEILGSAAGNEISFDKSAKNTDRKPAPVQQSKVQSAGLLSSATEDKLKAEYLKSTSAGLKEDKYVNDFSQDVLRDSMCSDKNSSNNRSRLQDSLHAKDKIQRIKNSLNFMDDAEEYENSRPEKVFQNVVIGRPGEQRHEYVDEVEEEEADDVPVPERIDEEAEIERAYDPTYRSSVTNETLYQTSSRDYKSAGSNRNVSVNTNSFKNNAKLNQPVQSRGTHDSKNSGKKVQIPMHRFNSNDKRGELEGTQYYNFAN